MPKSKSRKQKPKSNPKSQSKRGFSIEESRLLAMAAKFEAAPTIPLETLEQFKDILGLYGQGLWQEFSISASASELNLSRFTLFGPHDEDGWTVMDQRCALLCLGFTCEEEVKKELLDIVRKEPGPVVATYMLTLPRVPSFPFVVFCLMCDKGENIGLAVLIEDGFHFLADSAPFLDAMLETIVSIEAEALPVNVFNHLARDLMVSTKKPLSAYSVEEVEALLKMIGRDIGDALFLGQCKLLDAFRRTMSDIIGSYRDRLEQQHAESEALQAKTVKKMTSHLEKVEMMLKGCQERATKLEADLTIAKKKAKEASAPSTEAMPGSLPQALDKLLAAFQ